jgi:hypothetical protein
MLSPDEVKILQCGELSEGLGHFPQTESGEIKTGRVRLGCLPDTLFGDPLQRIVLFSSHRAFPL